MPSGNDSDADPPGESTALTYDCEWDSSRTGEPTDRIVSTVARLENCDPAVLPPLYDAVDPEALNDLFSNGTADAGGVERLQLRYHGYVIAVTSSTLSFRKFD